MDFMTMTVASALAWEEAQALGSSVASALACEAPAPGSSWETSMVMQCTALVLAVNVEFFALSHPTSTAHSRTCYCISAISRGV